MKRMFTSIACALGAAFIVIGQGCASLPDQLIWKNEDADQTAAKRKNDEQSEVTPEKLKTGLSSPITSDDAKRTPLSRPKVVKTELLGNEQGGKKYFDVVDKRPDIELAPETDPNANPVRVVTYDNNSVEKDYRLRFGVVWGRLIEAMLKLPLDTVDRSSGIIITGWIIDRSGPNDVMNFLGGGDNNIRYKYTIRVLDRGSMTQIKVIPFAQQVKSRRWSTAKPSIIVTNRLFSRIDRELSVPLPNERN